MRKKGLLLLTLVCCLSTLVASAASDVTACTFAKSVAELKAAAIERSTDPSFATNYQLTSGADAIKVTVDLKKGESVLVSCTSFDPANGRGSAFIIDQPVLIGSNGRKTLVTSSNADISKGVLYKFSRADMVITYNGKKLPNSYMAAAGSTFVVTADEDKTFSFDVMVTAQQGAVGNLAVIKVTDTDAINAVACKYPEEVALYSGLGQLSLFGLVNSLDVSLEQGFAKTMIKQLDNPADYVKAYNATASMDSDQVKLEAYLDLMVKADKAVDLQERLSWLNANSIQMAFDQLKKVKGYDVATNTARLTELKSLISKGFDDIYLVDGSGIAGALKALDLQKQIMLDNPAFNFDEILVGRYNLGVQARSANPGHMGTAANNWSNQTSARRDGFDGELGKFTNIKGDMQYEQIYKPEWSTSLPDIRLNYDGNRVLFSMSEQEENHWQVYEYDMAKKELTQVTYGAEEDLDYFDAAYMPNGKIALMSNVGGQGVPCVNGADQVGNLCTFDPVTKDMRRLTFDQDANWGPTMMHNGKLMYTRWEYTDLTHYFSRFVFSMNPDGTEQKALFGSGMVFPNSNFDVQPLPDHPSRFVGIVSGHHGTVRSGRLFLYDPAVSRNTIAGMVHEFPHRGREIDPIVKDKLVDGVWPQFVKPFPVDNENILVTAKMSPEGLWGIYLVDVYDNLVLLAEFEGEGIIHATPIRETKKQPIIPDKVDLTKDDATVFIQDIYEGEGLPGVPRGTVTQLRIHTYEYAYLKSPSNHYAMGMQSGWDMKTCLGIVDVEEDGSVIFKIPANTPISIQPLDSEGRAVQWMRSWFVGMPGETVSCVGCHEDQNQIPIPKRVIASAREPRELEVPAGGLHPMTFDLDVQPILDRNCISCHSEGKKLDFTGGKKAPTYDGFGTSCLALAPYVHRQGSEAGMIVLVPYEYHASVSPLVQILKNGHYGVELTDKEWRELYNWIDYNVPDMGQFKIDDAIFPDQYNRRIRMAKKYANGTFVDWRARLESFESYLDAQPEQAPVVRNYTAPKFKDVKAKGFPTEVTKGETKVVEIAPGVNITFVKVPAGKFVMGENKANSNTAPEIKASVDKAFWMSTTELTNAQVRALQPTHNSRFYDQTWKDHTTEGYPANGDDQVAIRISWNQANDYAKLLAAKTGENVMLPTETQWEWAAKAGSDSDYWYGTANTDFSTKENLSDAQMNKMAVFGVDPQPMPENHPYYQYASFHPKDESVDDGHMLTAAPGSFEANGFGLYDMIGNVSEWTRSDYALHGSKSKEASEYKVVKGGAWDSHPKDARVAVRKYFYPWQAPYNVGVRLVIED